MTVTFTVRGIPVPQGSARAFIAGGRAIVATEAHRGSLGAWRTAIAQEARAAIGDAALLAGPVAVRVDFVMARPRSHYLPANGRRSEPVLRLDAPMWHTGKPDVNKLERALFDALKAVVWHDDEQVVDARARKPYTLEAGPSRYMNPGAVVSIRPAGWWDPAEARR
jgi:Holliday junction resolvase RusA-like endonuclease